MQFDLNIGTAKASNVRIPNHNQTTIFLANTQLRTEAQLANQKCADIIDAFSQASSDHILVQIPGATIFIPVRRPRLLRELPDGPLTTMTRWTLEELCYVEELMEVKNG